MVTEGKQTTVLYIDYFDELKDVPITSKSIIVHCLEDNTIWHRTIDNKDWIQAGGGDKGWLYWVEQNVGLLIPADTRVTLFPNYQSAFSNPYTNVKHWRGLKFWEIPPVNRLSFPPGLLELKDSLHLKVHLAIVIPPSPSPITGGYLWCRIMDASNSGFYFLDSNSYTLPKEAIISNVYDGEFWLVFDFIMHNYWEENTPATPFPPFSEGFIVDVYNGNVNYDITIKDIKFQMELIKRS